MRHERLGILLVTSMVVIQYEGRWLRFTDPIRVVSTADPGSVQTAWRQIAAAAEEEGLYAAGFISYEASAALGMAVHSESSSTLPLVWFGLYDGFKEIPAPQPSGQGYRLGSWSTAVSRSSYEAAISQVKAHIANGETYQINYTFQMRACFQGNSWDLFCDLAQSQRAEFMAYVETGEHIICSASPELFFRLDGELLESRPMKGTAARGRTLAEDQRQIAWLHRSEKNRAENVMITDMIRNDMGRVSQTGTVHVPRLFDVERYPTVLQMTSTVASRSKASVAEILEAMFPCASITGAPKFRTMQIIKELEHEPRGVYTGSVGVIGPGRKAQLNVAIRTVLIEKAAGTASYGVGGGIVWDSDTAEEYDECRMKAAVLTQRRPAFQLLESLLWRCDSGYFLLDEHLDRLGNSAEYFGIPLDRARIAGKLAAFGQSLAHDSKVRLLVDEAGNPAIESSPLDDGSHRSPVRIGLIPYPIDIANPYLYHKTTRRQVYQEARAARPECDDVVLWNAQGEVTETSIANLVLEIDGQLVTPPVASGLLPGTFREALLRSGELRERVISVEELPNCQRIWLINSVQRWREAILIPELAPASYGFAH